MKKQARQIGSKEEIEQFEDDPFLKGAHKKRRKSGSKPISNWEKSVSNLRENMTIYFLVLSIALIGVLIFKFQSANSLEQNKTAFLNEQKNSLISQQQNLMKSERPSEVESLMSKRLKYQSMIKNANSNLPSSPLAAKQQIVKSQSLTDKTLNFVTSTDNLPTQIKKDQQNLQKINQDIKQQSQKEDKTQIIAKPQEKKQENKQLTSNDKSIIQNNLNKLTEEKQPKPQQKEQQVKSESKDQQIKPQQVKQETKSQQSDQSAKIEQIKQEAKPQQKEQQAKSQQKGKQSVSKENINGIQQKSQTSNEKKLQQNNEGTSSQNKEQQDHPQPEPNEEQNVDDAKQIENKEKEDKQRADKQKADKQKADKQKADKQKADKQKADKQKADKQKAEKQKAEKQKAEKQKAEKQKNSKQDDKNKENKDSKQKKKDKPKQPKWPKANLTKQQYTFAVRRMALKNQTITESSPLADEQRKYFEQKYHLSKYTTELPICIVVPSYNNVEENRHFQNMRSILMQEYKNYHVVFIDDASPDKTGEQIQEFMKNQTILPPERYQIIINKQQHLAMPNLRMAAKERCKPEQIFIIVDGDDELLGRQVLRLFNAIFQEKKVWFMYTNYLPKDAYVGYSQEIPEDVIKGNNYRDYKYSTSHLRAYYTQLFRNIKDSDLQDDKGNFLRAANDVATIFPIMEQAQDRVIYVPEYTYYYNDNTGINNRLIRKQEQLGNEKMLRKRKRYKRLDNLMSPVE